MKNLILLFILAIGLIVSVILYDRNRLLETSEFESLYYQMNNTPKIPKRVYHLGHSLVGRDIPIMLQQLARHRHSFHSQLGWGTSLMEHWEESIEINGFETENAHSNFREAHTAIGSGDYDVIVLTEMVDLKDAIKYFHTDEYLYLWSNKARSANPNVRIYLYETWHSLDHKNDWLDKLDNDLEMLWENKVIRKALSYEQEPKPIYVIPGGQVLASFVRYIENQSTQNIINDRYDLFTDRIHFNDYGAYLLALTHFAVIYGESPVGLPHNLLKADGSEAKNPGAEVALIMQEIVWDVVTRYDKTGVINRKLDNQTD